jgi:hypothetical protein
LVRPLLAKTDFTSLSCTEALAVVLRLVEGPGRDGQAGDADLEHAVEAAWVRAPGREGGLDDRIVVFERIPDERLEQARVEAK